MALAALATTADLEAAIGRSLTTAEAARADWALTAASGAVRDAAGVPFTVTESTVTVPAPDGQWLRLSPGPIRAVAAVSIDGATSTSWKLVGGDLWLSAGWSTGNEPVDVEVTYTHGYTVVPQPVSDLVVTVALAVISQAADGLLGPPPGVQSERAGDVGVVYAINPATGEAPAVSPLQLPDRTREWLRDTYGTSVYSVGQR